MMIVPKMFYNITNDLGPSDAQFIKWRRDEVPRYVFKKKDFEYIPTMSRVWDMVECVHARPETTTVQRTEHGRLAAGSGMVWSSVQGRFLSLRNRALILAMAMTGVRKNCIKKWTYGLIRECVEGRCGHNHPVTEGKIGFPFYLRITTGLDAKLREYKVPYYHTFLHRDGATPLLEYLSAREAAGWKPCDKSLIFVSEGPLNDSPMADNSIIHAVREAALLSPIDINPRPGDLAPSTQEDFQKSD